MNNTKIVLGLVLSGFIFTSCSKDDDINIIPSTNTDSFAIPTSYTFERNGTTTVDYNGQTSRLLMLQEIGNYIKSAGTNATTASATVLKDMYANTNSQYSSADLNSSGKQLKDKTAASRDYFVNLGGGGSTLEQSNVRSFFESQFDDAETASNGGEASEGIAGSYLDGSSTRLFAANGLEPQQVVLKGLMGACFMDQIVNNYLSTAVLDEGTNRDDNTNKVLVSGENYTNMEHKWDEAYGYIYGAGGGKYWDSYINQVDADADFGTLKEDIELAFRKGRAAIVANNYVVRDQQLNIIKEKLALVPAVRAVYYLKDGKSKLITDNGKKAFHALSEAYGFIISLRYTQNPNTGLPYMSKTEVDNALADLMAGTNGLYDVDYLNANLDTIATSIATKFGFTVAEAETIN